VIAAGEADAAEAQLTGLGRRDLPQRIVEHPGGDAGDRSCLSRLRCRGGSTCAGQSPRIRWVRSHSPTDGRAPIALRRRAGAPHHRRRRGAAREARARGLGNTLREGASAWGRRH
jgi:hypothetical protein